MSGYNKTCTSSPWCEDDVCRCEEWEEREDQEPAVIGIDYGYSNGTVDAQINSSDDEQDTEMVK